MSAENWTSEYFIANQNECLSCLADKKFSSTIVNLDDVSLNHLKHGQLVHFQGMIQDMRNPEIYYEKYTVRNKLTGETEIRNAKYKDMMTISTEEEFVDCSENQSAERQSFIVISIPGLNNWNRKGMETQTKQKYFDNIFDKSIQKIQSNKRNHEEMEIDDSNVSTKKGKTDSNDKESNSNESNNKTRHLLSTEHLMNFPVPCENGKSCIVKLYENYTSFKLNQVINITGFISLDPDLSIMFDSEEMVSDFEIQTHHPPASLIPRLHAIKVEYPEKPTIQNNPTLVSKFECIRLELHKILSHLLFNDNLATEYLICHLISSIYHRFNFLCLGSFPLNITNFQAIEKQSLNSTKNLSSNDRMSDFPKILYSFISLVIPKSVYLECSLENLNDLSFIPKKDYECDRLTSGILQLSHNTHLVIDETKLSSGQVSANGKLNYNALCDIINSQKLNYDFKYYQMEYETDIPILILSEHCSFINGTVRLPITSTIEKTEPYSAVVDAISMHLNDKELLHHIRDYLQILKFAEFSIEDEVTDVIQEDLVKLKSSYSKITEDDFHRCLVFSRLMALSNGLSKLTIDSWKRSLELEIERMERVSKMPISKKK